MRVPSPTCESKSPPSINLVAAVAVPVKGPVMFANVTLSVVRTF